MKRKHITLPTSRATSISSRQWRMTAFRSNRSARNSIESTTTREGRGPEEVHVQRGLALPEPRDDEVLREEPLLARDLGEEQDRGGPDEPAPDAPADDRDARGAR